MQECIVLCQGIGLIIKKAGGDDSQPLQPLFRPSVIYPDISQLYHGPFEYKCSSNQASEHLNCLGDHQASSLSAK